MCKIALIVPEKWGRDQNLFKVNGFLAFKDCIPPLSDEIYVFTLSYLTRVYHTTGRFLETFHCHNSTNLFETCSASLNWLLELK